MENGKVVWKDIYDIVSDINGKIDSNAKHINGKMDLIEKEMSNLKVKVAGIAAAVSIIITLLLRFLPQ